MNDDDGSLLSDPLLQRLFRIFILFCDINQGGQQRITPEQTHFIINQFFRISRPDDSNRTVPVITQTETVSFRDLIHLCDIIFPDRKILEPVIDRVFERFVSQIIYKGFVLCKRLENSKKCLQRSHKWHTYWCTLSPGTIYLWPLHKSTIISNRKLINLDQSSSVNTGTFEDERFTWQLNCDNKNKFLFGHFDELRRATWINEMQMAIDRRTKNDLLEYDRKCSKRNDNLLQREKNLSWRLALESENSRLMKLLDDERRALHDEEIVRTLAARMLDEEREKREALEKKLFDLERTLEMERNIANCVRNENTKKDCCDEKYNRFIISTDPV